MKSEELKQLKAWILVGTLCFTLGACSEKKKEEVQETCEEVVTQYKDTNKYLIAFIEGKAIIYENANFNYTVSEGYPSIYEDVISIKFIQVPCITLTGKENCIKFASEVVGEENIIFMSFTEGWNQELILTPNN